VQFSIRFVTCGNSETQPWHWLTGQLQEAVHHARCFSELTVGPQHVYNVLLARKARAEFDWDTSELESTELTQLAAWADVVADRNVELRCHRSR
jgi:hypothetical protein